MGYRYGKMIWNGLALKIKAPMKCDTPEKFEWGPTCIIGRISLASVDYYKKNEEFCECGNRAHASIISGKETIALCEYCIFGNKKNR